MRKRNDINRCLHWLYEIWYLMFRGCSLMVGVRFEIYFHESIAHSLFRKRGQIWSEILFKKIVRAYQNGYEA